MKDIVAAEGAEAAVAELLALRSQVQKRASAPIRKTAAHAGQYVSRNRGRGLEFLEVRHYQPGDDVRSIDWRISARSGKTHTRLYAAEKERPVLILCDMRQTMRFGTQKRFKSVQAANIAALVTWSALKRGDRAGGIICTNAQHIEVRPSRSSANAAKFLGLIAQHSAQPTQENTVNSTANMLAELRRVSRPGSKVFAISDFMDWNDDCTQQLALLCRHNDCHLIAVTDPFEHKLPRKGLFPLSDGTSNVLLSGSKHASSIAERFEQRIATLLNICQQHRASLSHIQTDQDPIAQLKGIEL